MHDAAAVNIQGYGDHPVPLAPGHGATARKVLSLPVGAVVRASAMHVATGKLARWDPKGRRLELKELVTDTKERLRELLQRAGVGDDVQPVCLLLWGEVVSNWWKHTGTPDMRYALSVDGQRVKLIAKYSTPRFKTEREEPDVFAESGRGIWLMNTMSEASWRWNGGELWLSLVVPLEG